MADHPKVIKKDIANMAIQPNVVDYDAARAAFNWEKAAEMVDMFDKDHLNIAYNCVDRHATGAKANKTALLFVEEEGSTEKYTYKDMQGLTNKFANVLQTEGVQKGDRVFLFLPSAPERYIAFLGILKLGAIAGTMFAAFQEDALLDRLGDSEASVIVTDATLYPRIKNIQDRLPKLTKIILVERGAEGELPAGDGIVHWSPAMAAASDAFECAKMAKNDYSYMLYTSGTTGKPKGIVHGHYDIVQAVVTGKYVLDIQDNDVYWCTADLGWVTGVVYGVLAVWGLGGTSLVYAGRFSPDNWYKVLQDHKVTIWYSAPTAIRMLMGAEVDAKAYDLSSLRHLCSVGEPLNPEAIWWGLEAFGLPFHDTWWQTELGSISITNMPAIDVKPGSMGKPLPGIEAAVIDDAGNVLPAGEQGNLALKASTVSALMKTVWNNEEKFQSYFVGDWYLSGDSAVMDTDGYFWFIGRVDDVINTAGERIGPFEVESALVEYPDVIEAAVIGKPDDVRGEIIKAFVVVKDDVEQTDELKEVLKKHVKEHLAGHAYPREIDFIERLPKTRSGKIMRRVLKAQELGLPTGDTSTLENY
ncbi:MAG: acetate--CoA ligase [Candidatus Saccharimonadales bacterium]